MAVRNWREVWPDFSTWLDGGEDPRTEDPDGENPYEEEA